MFVESGKNMLMTTPVVIFDSFRILREHSTGLHGRMYRYTTKLSGYNNEARAMFYPWINSDDIFRLRTTFIHYPLLTEESRRFRVFTRGHDWYEQNKNRRLWFTDKDVREMTRHEVDYVLTKTEPAMTIAEYLKDKKI